MKFKSKMVRGAKAVAVLVALVLCALCVCFVSCSDDDSDDDSGGGTEPFSGTVTATLNGEGDELGTVTVVVKYNRITSVTVYGTACTAQNEYTFTYSSGTTTCTITVSGTNGVYRYTYIKDGTFTATLDGEGNVGTVTVVVADGEITSVTVDDTECKQDDDDTFTYSSSTTTCTISVSVTNGVCTYEITAGTFTATFDGEGNELGTVTVAVEYGEITSVTVDDTECTAQDDGTYSYSDDEHTYAITISSSEEGFYYTYEITGSILTATLDGEGDGLGTVSFVVTTDGEITSVTVDDTECTEQDDGTFTYASEGYIYILTISGGNESYSYSYEEASECFGSSDTDYSSFVSLLSSLSDGFTIVLYPYLTTAQLEHFAAALKASSLSNVTVDMSYMPITEISEKFFYEYTNIASVILPSCLETIGSYAFYSCTKLTSIEIPDSVTSIGSHAFYGCTSLETVVIGDGVKTIPSYAFCDCTSLTTVTIGSAVTTITYGAFRKCSKLGTVIYNGTKSDWKSISIDGTDSVYGNEYLTKASIICTDGTYSYD